jgi:hypothetical protein
MNHIRFSRLNNFPERLLVLKRRMGRLLPSECKILVAIGVDKEALPLHDAQRIVQAGTAVEPLKIAYTLILMFSEGGSHRTRKQVRSAAL